MEYIFETAHLRVRKFVAEDARKLYENHLEPETAVALFHTYGKKAVEIVYHNPYVLAGSEIGVPFFKADELAIQMGFCGDSRERLEAAVVYELRFNAESGHSFIPREKLCSITAKLSINLKIV